VILVELAVGPKRRRVGILPDGRTPARDGAAISDATGLPLGTVTSGGFGPTVERPIAMGYVTADHAKEGSPLILTVRDRPLAARVAKLSSMRAPERR